MRNYKIKVKLNNQEFTTEIQGNNWTEVIDYVFGRIEVIDIENDN